MAVKLEQIQRGEGVRRKLAERPMLADALRYGAYIALGTAMGAAELFSGCGPFGLALVGACSTELEGLLCLMGTLAGYLISGGLGSGVRFIAAMFLLFTVKLLCRDSKLSALFWLMPAGAMLFTLATGLFYTAGDSGILPRYLNLAAETVLSGLCCAAFQIAMGKGETETGGAKRLRWICLGISGACALMSLRNIGLFEVLYAGPFLSVTGVMLAAYGGGAFLGCAVGAGFGLAMDLARDAALYRCACYALSAMAAGAFRRRGRFPFVMVYCVSDMLCAVLGWSGNAEISLLYECFAAAVVFMLLPASLVEPICALLQNQGGSGETAFRRYQAARMQRLSDAFERLHRVVNATISGQDGKPDVEAVFDRAADAICHSCPGKEICWQKEAESTLATLCEASDAMLERGYLRWEDLAERFRMRCLHKDDFLCAVNSELRGMYYRQQFIARLDEVKTAAYGQFADISSVLHDVAGEFFSAAGPDLEVEHRLTRFMKSARMQGSCAVFRDGRGRIRVVIESEDVQELCQSDGWLERLSQLVGVPLCRMAGEHARRLMLIQSEPLAVSVGIAAVKKEGESISGDRSCYFKTDAGYLCVILSDGMGTGPEAAVESSAAVKILEEFLRSGVEPETAMRLLNAAVMLKNGDRWGCATVDLCCVDLFTGQTSFYKYGAAPSYIKTGRAIRRIKGKSMAAGLMAGEESAPDVVKMKLRVGNVALIASDGVLAEDNDQWLRDILAGEEGMEMKELALQALQKARERFGAADDMTVLAIRVENRP